MKLQPTQFRDFRKGINRPNAINAFLVPDNSVSFSVNVNYDEIIGSAKVRKGTTKLGSTVASNKTPLGLANFVGSGGSPNIVLAVYSGASNASIYYYNGSWNTSGATSLNNSAKNRFAVLGGRVYRVSSGDAMTSSADGNTWATTNCITTDSVVPSLIFKTKGRLLASGYSGFKDRVYFSSVIDPNASPTITWSTNPSTGNWIDINPDDGGNITGFAESSNMVLVFKDSGMYRLNVISKTVDTENVFNIGAVSQEAIVNCQGVVYFFSGQDIRRTVGDYPSQISRLGVQDLIDAIPQANWSNVAAGTDGLNVYFSIGDITLNANTDDELTLNNVVLKFSPRDETWSIHSYADEFRFFTQFLTSSGKTFIGADTDGDVQTLNSGQTDNTTPIYFDLQTQEIDFGNRAANKTLSDKIVVFTQNGIDSQFEIKVNEEDFKSLKMDLSQRVNIGRELNFTGRFFVFRWNGLSTGARPIFEGFYLENIDLLGVN